MTKQFDSGVGHNECHDSCMTCNGAPCELAQAMIDKLAYYEDLEEHGRLIELPCAVGDKVYSVHSAGLSHGVIAEVDKDAFFLMLCVAEGRFGKTVFTTQEEAEAKLSEMEGAE